MTTTFNRHKLENEIMDDKRHTDTFKMYALDKSHFDGHITSSLSWPDRESKYMSSMQFISALNLLNRWKRNMSGNFPQHYSELVDLMEEQLKETYDSILKTNNFEKFYEEVVFNLRRFAEGLLEPFHKYVIKETSGETA